MPSRAGVDHPPSRRLWRTSSGFVSAICQSDGQIRAHAQELIIFSRGGKTDWGKKRGIFEVLFQPRINWIDTDIGKADDVDGKGF